MRRSLALVIVLVLLVGTGSALAVSDGHYSPSRQHCPGSADNHSSGAAVAGCYNMILELLDGSGHSYFGAGGRQTALDNEVNTFDVWIDPGQGQRFTWTVTADFPPSITGPAITPGTAAKPAKGLQLYFGADDNLENGEHDSSSEISNGPSDGGGISLDLTPAAATSWLKAVRTLDVAGLLTHPAPVGDAGLGACVDGLCLSAGAVRQVAFQGGAASTRDAPNYAGKQWDPRDCDGEHSGENTCGPGGIQTWFDAEGTVYVEPGLSLYEDPDPQGSPAVFEFLHVPADDPYPAPALSLGPCGFVFGGGPEGSPFRFDGGPSTNAAGQIVVPTAC